VTQTAVIFGGPSPEHDVSILIGLPATRALAAAGHDVAAIYWSKTGDFFAVEPDAEKEAFYDGVPRKSRPLTLGTTGFDGKKAPRPDVVVNCCHGGPGEDGTLQAALDLARIPYTGPTVAGAALGMDKFAFGAAVAAAGLPTLPRAVVSADAAEPPFAGPYIVKPRFGGSSIGIEVAADWPTARALAQQVVHYRAGAVVEPYRPDSVDLNIAARAYPAFELSAIEKPLREKGILDYRDKYLTGGGEGMASAPKELPASIASEIEKQLREAAATVATVAGLRGIARIDFLLDGDDLYVNEINTIPGSLAKHLWIDPPISLTQLLLDGDDLYVNEINTIPGSLAKHLWDVPFASLLDAMLEEAGRRPTTHYTTAGADGTALRAAGTIASKLG